MIQGRWLKKRLTARRPGYLLPDALFVRWQYEVRMGKPLRLDPPTTFSEKIVWLKLNWQDPRGAQLADKLAVRGFVEERCGPRILNEIYRVYDSVDAIDPVALPDSFALRPTHSSGNNVICPDRSGLDWPAARATLRRAMSRNFYWVCREPVYRQIPRRIICERFLGHNVADYKFFCFGGQPRFVQVDTDRFIGHRRAFFELDWNLLPFRIDYPHPREPVPAPARLSEMIAHAARLSAGFPFVRVDLYDVDDRVVFGELTFFPDGGLCRFAPDSADREVGELLTLPAPAAVGAMARAG